MVKLVSDDADRKESLRARLRPIAEIFVQAIRDRGERGDTVIPIRALLDIMAKSDKYDLDDINETLRMVENLGKEWRIFKWKFFQLYPDLFRLSDYKEGVGWSVSLVAPRYRVRGKKPPAPPPAAPAAAPPLRLGGPRHLPGPARPGR